MSYDDETTGFCTRIRIEPNPTLGSCYYIFFKPGPDFLVKFWLFFNKSKQEESEEYFFQFHPDPNPTSVSALSAMSGPAWGPQGGQRSPGLPRFLFLVRITDFTETCL